jgi:transcriptional regulator with XRE-family HTH domain
MTFRAVLRAEFDRRHAFNPRYSLRAFARALDVDHATLSQLLRGTRRLTAARVRTLGRRLQLPDAHIAEHAAVEDDARVLEAIGRIGFRASSRWVATVTNLPVDAVNVTLQRLLRQRLLTMASRDRWVRTEDERG